VQVRVVGVLGAHRRLEEGAETAALPGLSTPSEKPYSSGKRLPSTPGTISPVARSSLPQAMVWYPPSHAGDRRRWFAGAGSCRRGRARRSARTRGRRRGTRATERTPGRRRACARRWCRALGAASGSASEPEPRRCPRSSPAGAGLERERARSGAARLRRGAGERESRAFLDALEATDLPRGRGDRPLTRRPSATPS
jgi:hypothetical protein